MPKNIVICLDGTNNTLRAAVNTNVVRLFSMLELRDPTRQVAYYDPGVGTFSSPAAWTPPARTLSRYAGLLFGAGLRQNLGEAYTYLMSTYEEGDKVFVFGFSRGAYNARALCGLLEVCGLLRRGEENLVPYLVSAYAKNEGRDKFPLLNNYSKVFSRSLEVGQDRRRDRFPVHFVGVWDTVKAAGHLGRTLRWPYTRKLPNVATIRHAVSIDERRRPFASYLFTAPDRFGQPVDQDRSEVWFAGVHSDVGGMFPKGERLSDIPLKWMAEQAVAAGLAVKKRQYDDASKVTDAEATGAIHTTSLLWYLLGPSRRRVPVGATIHASVQRRIAADPSYARHLPSGHTFVDETWSLHKPLPKTSRPRARQPRTIDLDAAAEGRSGRR